MANVTGIAITIKAWLPTGKTLDEQFAALSIVKTAHESGDYAALLTASKIEGVQTEQKTRRFEDQPQDQPQGQQQPAAEPGAAPAEQTTLAGGEQQQEPAAGDESHPMSEAIKAERKADTAKTKAA